MLAEMCQGAVYAQLTSSCAAVHDTCQALTEFIQELTLLRICCVPALADAVGGVEAELLGEGGQGMKKKGKVQDVIFAETHTQSFTHVLNHLPPNTTHLVDFSNLFVCPVPQGLTLWGEARGAVSPPQGTQAQVALCQLVIDVPGDQGVVVPEVQLQEETKCRQQKAGQVKGHALRCDSPASGKLP